MTTYSNRDKRKGARGPGEGRTGEMTWALALILAITAAVVPALTKEAPGSGQSNQANPSLQTYFRQYIGLGDDQIAAIQSGQPVSKALPSRTPAEVFLWGAVYIHATPESYLKFAHDFDRLRKLPNYLALGVFSDPPRPSDLDGFSFTSDEVQALKNCKSGDCQIQLPEDFIEQNHETINWSAPDVDNQVNQLLHKRALERLLTYQSQGNQALGVYNDKHDTTQVADQFAYMLSYDKALPAYLPDFYHYLLNYPRAKPANVEDKFYWARVKFGLKPTLRVVQIVTLRGNPGDPLAYAIAEKQLYASHYFETALDMSFCVRGDDPKQPGFYLIMTMGSEQAGLTGFKGSIVRHVAVGRSVNNLRDALASIKATLESSQ
jgi:hypothetical protein